MNQSRRLAPTRYIPTGLYSLDGWPTLPARPQTEARPGLLDRMTRTFGQMLFRWSAPQALVPNRSAA